MKRDREALLVRFEQDAVRGPHRYVDEEQEADETTPLVELPKTQADEGSLLAVEEKEEC